MDGVEDLSEQGVPLSHGCKALSVSRATFYRHRRMGRVFGPQVRRPTPKRALSQAQRQAVLDLLYSERYRNDAPVAVYASLLEQGKHLCSPHTMYRLLKSQKALRERRNLRTHPSHRAPDLVATGPNQVWSWDITKLRGSHKGQWLYLYVVIDIYSRYVVGWMVATTETGELYPSGRPRS